MTKLEEIQTKLKQLRLYREYIINLKLLTELKEKNTNDKKGR